jgi:hypothetical protein
MGGDSGGSMDGIGMDGGGDEGNGVLYDGGVSRRLMSSSPSLGSSTSHRRFFFLVRLAGGEMGGGHLAEAWALAVGALAVGAMTGYKQAVMVAGGYCWRRRRRLRTFAAVICVRKRQKMVTSW